MTANICSAGNDINQQKVTVVATPTPQIKDDRTTVIPPPDSDYWDNDDFVPYQSNRHDEFDWKLTKVDPITFGPFKN